MAGRHVVGETRRGFVEANAIAELADGVSTTVTVRLVALGPRVTFEATSKLSVVSEGARVELPADGVVDAMGAPVTGNFELTVSPIDPTIDLRLSPSPLEGISVNGGDAPRLTLHGRRRCGVVTSHCSSLPGQFLTEAAVVVARRALQSAVSDFTGDYCVAAERDKPSKLEARPS